MQEAYYTLTGKLSEVVKQSPSKVVCQIKKSEGYKEYTYQDLYDSSRAIANSLIKAGIQKEDRIAVVLENRPEWVFIYFGILWSDGVVE
ncbi:MAG: long-chain fatty acid--CoA ligase [Coxiellaceae bacterium]|jgi:long-chain acyl-CoA synthetase|nr:long-chain fatty acid--CoA ligase [Coxiellaceae bacterium]